CSRCPSRHGCSSDTGSSTAAPSRCRAPPPPRATGPSPRSRCQRTEISSTAEQPGRERAGDRIEQAVPSDNSSLVGTLVFTVLWLACAVHLVAAFSHHPGKGHLRCL